MDSFICICAFCYLWVLFATAHIRFLLNCGGYICGKKKLTKCRNAVQKSGLSSLTTRTYETVRVTKQHANTFKCY